MQVHPIDDKPAMRSVGNWLEEHNVTEVEAIIADMTGIARGKFLPAQKYREDKGMRLPEALFLQTVTGEYPDDERAINPAEIDMVLKPDPASIRMLPWANEPTAMIIHNCFYADGSPVGMSPRYVLQRVLDLYARQGWEAVVAPELEFYLVKPNTDADYPLEPPVGRSGRAETGRQSFSIDAINEFDPLFEDLYDFCEVLGLEVDTLVHEAGAAQMEVNLRHGAPVDRADQAFLLKRAIREAAMRHDMYATFMSKPMESEPGSSMHVHQSIIDKNTGSNIFSQPDGGESAMFLHYIAGLQKYLPDAMSLFAPNVNSYRRIQRFHSAPINVQWGYDNRTAGLRVPISTPVARRVENRLGGADSNPYLAIAASLACGYLGMMQQLQPTEALTKSAYELPYAVPRSLHEALARLVQCQELGGMLGEHFVIAYNAVKKCEYETYSQVISSWEREFLLLNV